MQNTDSVINRAAQSPVLTFDLEQIRPQIERIGLDLAPLLHQGLILREKDFRDFIEQYPWHSLKGKAVALFCSAEAIIPQWVFAVMAAYAAQYADMVLFGGMVELEAELYNREIDKQDLAPYTGKVVVIKGCSDHIVPIQAYVKAAAKLSLIARKILYGEPCSAVPVFKK